MNRIWLAVGCSICLMGSIIPADAAYLSKIEESLILFYSYVRTIDAVRVDIERFAVYRKGNQGLWEDRIAQDLKELSRAENEIREKSWPEEMALLRPLFVATAEAVEAYASAFLNASSRDVDITEDLLTRHYDRLRNKLDQVTTAFVVQPKLAEDFDPLDEEYRVFSNDGGREEFRKAAFLLEERRFDVSLAELAKLREKYRGTSAEGSLVLRMVRCVLRDQEVTIPAEQEKVQIKMLEDIISNRVYYPNAYDIYVEWRTLYQGYYYGVSGDVEIPNLQYLEKLKEVVATLRHHIEVAPKDAWARAQLWMLVRLPVLSRSGPISSEADVNFLGME